MPAIWQQRFGFLQQATGAPIVVGELGGFYSGKDKLWQDWAIDYMARRKIGVFYFALNPGTLHQTFCNPLHLVMRPSKSSTSLSRLSSIVGSKDTGGLLANDFSTPVADKLMLLERMPSTNISRVREVSLRLRSSPPPLAPPPHPPRPPPVLPPNLPPKPAIPVPSPLDPAPSQRPPMPPSSHTSYLSLSHNEIAGSGPSAPSFDSHTSVKWLTAPPSLNVPSVSPVSVEGPTASPVSIVELMGTNDDMPNKPLPVERVEALDIDHHLLLLGRKIQFRSALLRYSFLGTLAGTVAILLWYIWCSGHDSRPRRNHEAPQASCAGLDESSENDEQGCYKDLEGMEPASRSTSKRARRCGRSRRTAIWNHSFMGFKMGARPTYQPV